MRKVLSFVLVLSLVLGSFSMAFAGSEAQASLSDIAGHANEEAITVNFNLNIINGMGDGTFAPDQAVTRAQFAAMITRALAIPESALAGYTATTFKDTTGYGWAVPYLAFCQSKGILVGDGAGNVMPGRTVSVNEAVTMVMRAAGYTNNSAALVGVWPANYVSLAQNNGLYDKVATAVGVTRANAAQIIYNALTVDKVEVAADGTTKVLSDRTNADAAKWKIVNMLTTGLDAYADVIVVNGDEPSLINLKPYIGKLVTVYKEKAKTDRILAVASEETTAVVGSFADDVVLTTSTKAITFDNIETFEGDDDVDYTVKNASSIEIYSYMINGADVAVAKTGTVIPSTASITINGDISGKYITDVWTITGWEIDNAKKVNKADLNQIEDGSLLTSDFETLKDGSIDPNSFELVGVKALKDIKEGNVVYVYEKAQDGDIVKVEVGTEVVEGKVTSVKSGDKFVVNGKTYEAAGTMNSKAVTFKAGDTVKLYLDVNGDIYTYDVTSGKTDKYAVVMDNDTKYSRVKLYTAADESAWFDFTDDVPVAAVTTDSATGIQGFSLVAYSLDKNGKVDNATNGSITVKDHATLSALVLSTDGNGSFRVASDAVVYGVSNGAVKVATTIGNVDTGTDLGKVAFITDDKVIVALMVNNDFASKTDKDSYAVISEVNSIVNKDDDSVQQVIGLVDGAALDKETTGKATADNVLVDVPGLYKVEYDADGLIKKVTSADSNPAAGLANKVAVGGLEVGDVDGNALQISGSAIWDSVAKDAKVYRAIMKDGKVDSYKLSDVSAINKGHFVYLYNTVDEDDAAGFDVVIYVTKK